MPIDVYLNVAVAGILTGLVYGLMALGLSVIFGVVRVVNFAHGEMMTIAMYLAVVLFAQFQLAAGDSGQIQQVVHQPGQVPYLAIDHLDFRIGRPLQAEDQGGVLEGGQRVA